MSTFAPAPRLTTRFPLLDWIPDEPPVRPERTTGRLMTKPTMSDVARQAGVDVSTVSRALNTRTAGMLRDETVERVLSAAQQLGYQPNVLARGLRTQKSHTVGMVIPDLTNPFFPPIVRGVQDVLDADGYTLILTNTDNDARREELGFRSLVGRQVDGLVIATSHLEPGDDRWDGAADTLPKVQVNRRGSHPMAPSVAPDDADGATQVLEHLMELGHRQIAHIAGPPNTSTGRTRATTFAAHAAESGVFDPELVEVTSSFSMEEGRAACQRLVERRPDVTAIFAANDLLAIGCLRELGARGRHVPEQVSLVGFNDMPLVDLMEPPLTTMRIPGYEMGRIAGRILLDLLEDTPGQRTPAVVDVHPELVVRRSTGPAPG